MVEIPLNSPDPLSSVARIARELSGRCRIGAGTVLDPADVRRIAEAGGQFVVSPNFDAAVVAECGSLGLACYPGVFTASECFAALKAGADGLKIFPAEIMGPSGVRALRAVLPRDVSVYAVGGANPDRFAAWRAAGVNGFGLGAYLYRAGRSVSEVRERAERCVSAYDALPDRNR